MHVTDENYAPTDIIVEDKTGVFYIRFSSKKLNYIFALL